MAGLAEILAENTKLRDQLAALEREQEALQEELAKREAMLEAVKAKAEDLAKTLEFLRRKTTGPASQRFVLDPNAQALLPFPGGVEPPPRAPEPDAATGDDDPKGKTGKRRPRRRNREAFDHLESRSVRCRAAEASCVRCGGALKIIGQATSFRVEWVPGHFIVEDVIRDKCACPSCPGEGVLTVPAPYALDRALCGNQLLARVLVDKFSDHLPLHRQARRMRREGFDVGSNTLANWTCAAGGLLRVVADAVRVDLLQQAFLQGDDTGMPVQDGGDGALRKGRMWAFTDQAQVYYAFTDTKDGKHPAALLQGFDGELLLVDGGTEFNRVVHEQKLKRAGCWSHLRTYFFHARHDHPEESRLALGTILDLFMIERELWGGAPDEIRAGRQERALPLVDGFFAWVTELSKTVRPTSRLGEAVGYARNQEATLRVHLDHGELPMHNNLSELMLRQTVVGRKNWLFARSEGGAQTAATCFTLIGSCMLQGIDPHRYLADILPRLPDYPSHRVKELTPRAWRAAREGHLIG